MLTPARPFVRTDFPVTPEVQRQRELRSARRAAVTNRILRAAKQVAPPPTPRRAVSDPLALADRLAARKVSEIEKAEQEWRARLSPEAVQCDMEADKQKTSKPRHATRVPPSVIGGVYVPRRAAILARLATKSEAKCETATSMRKDL